MIENLTPEEAQRVLMALLRIHDDWVAEAESIAASQREMFDAVEIAESLVAEVLSLDIQDVNRRSADPGGYIAPDEAAWQLCDELVRPWQLEWDRRLKWGRHREASQILQGVLLGLHRLNAVDHDVLNWCSDYPRETAKSWWQRVRHANPDETLPTTVREQLDEWSNWFN